MTLPAQIEQLIDAARRVERGCSRVGMHDPFDDGWKWLYRIQDALQRLASPDLAALLAPRPDRAALERLLDQYGYIPTATMSEVGYREKVRQREQFRDDLMTWATTLPTEKSRWCEHIYQVPVYGQPGQYNWSLKKEPRSMDVQVFDDWIVCPLCGQPRPGGR